MRPTGQIHAADPAKSDRLKKFLHHLADHQWHGTLEIMQATMLCAINSVAAECRASGIPIECRCVGKGRYEYRLSPPVRAAPVEQMTLLAA